MQINKQEKSPIKQRILQYIEYKCITKYRFYKESGITRNILDQQTGISEDNISLFLTYAQDISPIWLLLGKGEMLKSDFSEEDKKNEHQDKKKCRDAQNNFSEKNVSPLNEFYAIENVSPIIENVSPLCQPNSENEPQRPFFSTVSEEPDVYRKIDVQEERFRGLLEGGGIKEILELKDTLISSQKAHIATLEAQLRDCRNDIIDLRRDLQELKNNNKQLDDKIGGTTKSYISTWDVVEDKKKR